MWESSISCHNNNQKILNIHKKKMFISILSFLLKFELNSSIYQIYRKYEHYFVLENV